MNSSFLLSTFPDREPVAGSLVKRQPLACARGPNSAFVVPKLGEAPVRGDAADDTRTLKIWFSSDLKKQIEVGEAKMKFPKISWRRYTRIR